MPHTRPRCIDRAPAPVRGLCPSCPALCSARPPPCATAGVAREQSEAAARHAPRPGSVAPPAAANFRPREGSMPPRSGAWGQSVPERREAPAGPDPGRPRSRADPRTVGRNSPSPSLPPSLPPLSFPVRKFPPSRPETPRRRAGRPASPICRAIISPPSRGPSAHRPAPVRCRNSCCHRSGKPSKRRRFRRRRR